MDRFLTRRGLGALAGLGSAALLLGALGFQYIGGLPPCPMCIWQRWPHLAAMLLALLLLALPIRAVALLGFIAAATTSGIGLFHAGVERAWWEGPTTCSGGPASGSSASDLLDTILAAPVVRCDDIVWEFLGLSMAGWNAVISAGLALLWLAAARRA